MSRLFDLPKVIEESVDLRSLRISKELAEIEDRAMTVLEARDAVSELGIRHWQDKERVHPIIKAISVEELDRWMPEDEDLGTLNIHQKTLLENIFPIKELAERLDTEKMRIAQEKSVEHTNLIENPEHSRYQWKEGANQTEGDRTGFCSSTNGRFAIGLCSFTLWTCWLG